MAKKAQTQVGGRAIRAIFADAKHAVDDDALPADHTDPNVPRDGIKAGEWLGAPHNKMPPDCPVRVIGRDAEGIVYAVTATNDFRAVERWDMPALADLFAPQLNYLMWAWPAKGEVKWTDASGVEQKAVLVKRVEVQKAMMCLKGEAARRPLFDPDKQRRGRGGWQDRDGNFIWHSGSWLWASEKGKLTRSKPGEHQGYLYTRQAETIAPWQEKVEQAESPARRILTDLKTWNWARPYLDPILLLGWFAVALMSGALKNRPVIFTTGGFGVGKTTLHELARGVLEGVVNSSVNTTAAGVYQQAKHDALPWLIDELEAKAGSTRGEAVIELARVAYSGGDISRGGADHQATSFKAHQPFLFSAIQPPPLTAQDKSRMAILNLSRLDTKNGIGRKVLISSDVDGRMLLRQVMDGWSEFQGRLMQNWWDLLAKHGLDARAIDTFGTLLAAAELLVGPEALEECGLPIADEAHLGELIAEATAVERSENLDNWHKCLNILYQSTIEQWRDGVKPTIGGVCEQLRLGPNNGGWDARGARDKLELVGLGCRDAGQIPGAGPVLAVPADGPVLRRIFADTEYYKGGWYTALKQAPAGIVIRDRGNQQKVKINGSTVHCLLVDLAAFEAFASALE